MLARHAPAAAAAALSLHPSVLRVMWVALLFKITLWSFSTYAAAHLIDSIGGLPFPEVPTEIAFLRPFVALVCH